MARRWLRAVACVLIGAVAPAIGAGCAAQRPAPDPPEPPGVGGGVGLEVRLVPVRDADHAVARVLGPFESNPIPAEGVLVHRWREAGLRLVAVPAAEVDTLLCAMAPAGIADTNTWAQMPLWHPLVAGAWGGEAVVRVGSGVIEVAPGRARLLCRAWFEPALAGAAVGSSMRIELLPQIQDPPGRPGMTGLGGPAVVSAGVGAQGPVLRDLALSISAEPGVAYLVVGEDPALDWADLPDPPPPPVPEPPAVSDPDTQGPMPGQQGGVPTPTDAPPVPAPDPVGPVPTRLRTLGEALLTDPGSAQRTAPSSRGVAVRPPTKLVVVLRPRPPGA